MLTEFINEITSRHLNVFGIVVIKDGEKAAEHHFTPEERCNTYSVTKSITSTAVGIAIEEGYFSLDDDILQFFKDVLPKDITEDHKNNLRKITVERLLTMSVADYWFDQPAWDNWLQGILAIPLPNVYKREFHYSNFTSYLAGVIVEKATGMGMMDYLKPRLFAPLDIYNVECAYSPEGHFYGSSGMKLNVNELSRFGLLYLQEGCYNGMQLVPKQWVSLATRKQIEVNEDGYGYYFWMHGKDSYLASGKKGQYCIVIPEKNAVITVLSDIEEGADVAALDRCIWDIVYPCC